MGLPPVRVLTPQEMDDIHRRVREDAEGPEWPFPDWGTVHDRDEPTKEAF